MVISLCEEIKSVLPPKITPEFAKGKHMKFEEAIEKLKEKLGKNFIILTISINHKIPKQLIRRFLL